MLRARRLPREPQPPDIRPQILVLLQRHAGRPVGVTTKRPGRAATPPREQEIDGPVLLWEPLQVREVHAAQDFEDLVEDIGVGHGFYAFGLGAGHRREEDAGTG